MKEYSDNIQNRFTARHQRCISICGDVKRNKILNIGSYNGWFERQIDRRGAKEVIGIDIRQKFLELAKTNVPGVKFIKMSALELNFSDNSFDLVTMFDVLEHILPKKETEVFRMVYKILKPKGRMIISVPNSHFFSNMLDPVWYLGHRHYNLKKLTCILNKTGFSVEKSEYGGGIICIFSMIFLYFFKYFFKSEIPFKEYIDKLGRKEYQENKKGVMTLFVVAKKR